MCGLSRFQFHCLVILLTKPLLGTDFVLGLVVAAATVSSKHAVSRGRRPSLFFKCLYLSKESFPNEKSFPRNSQQAILRVLLVM